MRRNIPARIEGRDIGKTLTTIVRSLKAKSVPNFIERVESWLAKQIERLAKSKNAEKRIEQTNDIADTLKCLAQDSKSVMDIESRIVSLFQDTDSNSVPAVILSSVHKAKGLEWPTVYLLSDTFRQSKGGEEVNIYYVAVTRAMRSLRLIGGKNLDAGEKSAEALASDCKRSQIASDDADTASVSPASNLPAVREPSVPATEVAQTEVVTPQEPTVPAYGIDPNGEPLILMERGMVFDINGVEHVCSLVDKDEGIIRPFRSECKPHLRIRLLGNKTKESKVIRRLSEQEIENFLTGSGPVGDETKQAGKGKTVMAKKAKAVNVKKSRSGRERAEDDKVLAQIKKSGKDASDQEIVDALRASGLGCSIPRVIALRGGKSFASKKKEKPAKATSAKNTSKAKVPARGASKKKVAAKPAASVPPPRSAPIESVPPPAPDATSAPEAAPEEVAR